MPTILAGRRGPALVALLAAVFAVWSLWPQRNAEWQVMDDGHVIAWGGPAGIVTAADFRREIHATELMQFAGSERYRPSLDVLHLAEAFVFGTKNPAMWFRWRMFMCAFAFAVAGWIITSLTGPLFGFAITAYFVTQFYWRDIWAHLFLSEPWAVAGSAIFAIGIWNARPPRNANVWLTFATLGFVIAGGAKENFLLLLPVLCWSAWRASKRSQLGSAGRGAVILCTLYAAIIAASVLLGSRRTGVDLYGNPTGLGGRLSLVLRPFPMGVVIAAVVAWFLVSWMARDARLRAPATEVDRTEAELHAALAVSAILVVSQFAYYAGDWPRFGSRFDFPGRLAESIILIAVARAWLRAGTLKLVPSRFRNLGTALAAVLILAAAARHATALRGAALDNFENTKVVGASIHAIANEAAANPGAPIVLLTPDDPNVEPVQNVASMLEAQISGHEVFVQIKGRAIESLAGSTEHTGRISVEGDSSRFAYFPVIQPISGLGAARAKAGGKCLAVQILDYRPPHATRCPD